MRCVTRPWARCWGLLLLLLFLIPTPAFSIPAFARKYQVRCTACHEAWPMLNDFGRAFRDNGYQMMMGKDGPTATPVGYWPVAFRLVPSFERDTINHQETDQGVKTLTTSNGFGVGAFDVLSAGTLAPNMSFLFVPAYEGGEWEVESAWVRFDNLGKSSWLNLKLGHHELDLPRSAHRPLNQTGAGFLVYSYHPPGSISEFDMGGNQDGVEWVGHDKGSLNRAAVSLFSVDGSPGSRSAFNTPGVYFHLIHEFLPKSRVVSEAKIGAFGADASWPTTFLTSDGDPIEGSGTTLKHSTRYGLEGHVLFGPNVTPFHALVVLAHGSDNRNLIEGATRNATWDGGFVELAWTPRLKTTPFFRYDWISNGDQSNSELASNANDQTQYTIGIRHTLNYSTRAEYALHGEYSALRARGLTADEPTVTSTSLFFGVDFAF
ncbi:MAG: hypothetical protein ABI718_00610 [Acidobacteriota bacterium]